MDASVFPPNILAKVDFSSRRHLRSGVAVLGLAGCCHKASNLSAQQLCFQLCFVHQSSLAKNFKKIGWSIRSSADGSRGPDPSSMNGMNSGTRLIRTIRNLQSKLGEKIKQLRKNLPLKLLFFLVGFYCATAFATVIGQTGDWDILSAALAVVVVEGIGALMYKGSLPLFSNIRGLITMFNYWKAGLSLGLFLDSFKYEMGNFLGSVNPFNFDMDLFPRFL